MLGRCELDWAMIWWWWRKGGTDGPLSKRATASEQVAAGRVGRMAAVRAHPRRPGQRPRIPREKHPPPGDHQDRDERIPKRGRRHGILHLADRDCPDQQPR